MSAVLILSTAPTQEEAERIAEALVAEDLAACVQLSPVESRYRWQGKVEHAAETRLHIKTMAHLAARVERRIGELHSYDVPEIVAVPITGGSPAYLGWIAQSVRAEKE